jgi:hypothetical protein
MLQEARQDATEATLRALQEQNATISALLGQLQLPPPQSQPRTPHLGGGAR